MKSAAPAVNFTQKIITQSLNLEAGGPECDCDFRVVQKCSWTPVYIIPREPTEIEIVVIVVKDEKDENHKRYPPPPVLGRDFDDLSPLSVPSYMLIYLQKVNFVVHYTMEKFIGPAKTPVVLTFSFFQIERRVEALLCYELEQEKDKPVKCTHGNHDNSKNEYRFVIQQQDLKCQRFKVNFCHRL